MARYDIDQSAPKRVILHAGLPKTGSSAIQSFLAENEDRLLDHHGIWQMPREDLSDLRGALLSIASFGMNPKRWWRLRQATRALSARVAVLEHDTVLVSHEAMLGLNSGTLFKTSFAAGPAHAIRAMECIFRGFEMTWLIYVRDRSSHMRSAYNQNVKVREISLNLDEWSRKHCPPGVFDTMLADIQANLAPKLQVIDYDAEKASDRLWGTPVLQAAGLSEAEIGGLTVTPPENESLPKDLLDFKRRVNALGLERRQARDVLNLLRDAYYATPPSDLPPR